MEKRKADSRDNKNKDLRFLLMMELSIVKNSICECTTHAFTI